MEGLSASKYQRQKSDFFRKGLLIALSSGICYGLYSAFITLGMSLDVWGDWYGPNTAMLSAFVITYMLGALGSAVNDTLGGIAFLGFAAIRGYIGDVFRCLKTRPGAVLIVCALIGGPIASSAFVIGLQMAGPMVVPITALCAPLGALLGRIFFKQKLNARMIAGVIISFLAAATIGWTSLQAVDIYLVLGCLIALIAALGWAIEGCVAGFGTSMVDSKIGVTIRQCTSGLSNMIILLPLFAIIAGDLGLAPRLLMEAYTSPAIIFFVISGILCAMSYALWYKGNAMCGAALGMTCNGAFAFWSPFFCWILMGVIIGEPGWALSPIQWVAAIVMIFGIWLLAMNPLDLFKGRKEVNA